MKETKIKYCPQCGTEGIVNKGTRYNCQCGFEYFHNVAAACAVIIEFEGNIIATIRKHNPEMGKLDLPGGFVDPYECVEDAVRREIKEELNLQLKDLRYIGSSHNRYPYSGIVYNTMDSFFIARVDSIDKIHVEDDIDAYVLIPKNELTADDFPFDSIKDGVRMYLKIASV